MRNIVLLAFLFFGIYANAQDINAAIEEFNQGNQALQSEDFHWLFKSIRQHSKLQPL